MALTDNLLGYWKLDEAAVPLQDETVNNNDLGTDGTSPTFQQTALAPDSTYSILHSINGGNYKGGSPTNLNPSGNMSVQVWANITTLASNKCFIGKNNPQRDYQIRVIDQGSSDYRFEFVIVDSGATERRCIGATSLSTSTTYHVVGVYDGTDMRLYVNGSLDSNGASNPLAFTGALKTNASEFWVGLYPGTVYLDEGAVWGSNLSAAEVLELYTYGMSGAPIVPDAKNLPARTTTLRESSKALLARITVYFTTATKNLPASTTVRQLAGKALLSRVTALRETSKALLARVTVYFTVASKNLPSRTTVLLLGTKSLIASITVYFTLATKNLVCRLTTLVPATKALVGRVVGLRESSKNIPTYLTVRKVTSKTLVSRITVYYTTAVKNLPARLITLRVSSKSLVSRLTSRIVTSKILVSRVTVYYTTATKNLLCTLNVWKWVYTEPQATTWTAGSEESGDWDLVGAQSTNWEERGVPSYVPQ